MSSLAAVGRFIDPDAGVLLADAPQPRKALFLDRDGIVNVDHNYVHAAQDTEWLPGIFDLAKAAHAAGLLLVVVTNQAGIARGFYDEQTFLAYTAWVHREFSARGAPLLATFFCPHHPLEGTGGYLRECDCRKPAPGMILAAAQAFAINLPRSMLIGDNPSDIAAAVAAGVGRTALVAEARKLPTLSDLFPMENR